MQKPERLIGFVEVDGTNFPFEFEEKTFTLNLYPPSLEAQDKKRFGFFEAMNNTAKNAHNWIPHKRISGMSFGGDSKASAGGIFFSSNSHYILFDVPNMETNYNGFISYQVNWYFLYTEGIRQFGISGFRLSDLPSITSIIQKSLCNVKLSLRRMGLEWSASPFLPMICAVAPIVANIFSQMRLLQK